MSDDRTYTGLTPDQLVVLQKAADWLTFCADHAFPYMTGTQRDLRDLSKKVRAIAEQPHGDAADVSVPEVER
jgi:hypothetical protein